MESPGAVLAAASPRAARWPLGSGARLGHALLLVALLPMTRGASAAETLQGWWEVPFPERLLGILIGIEAALTEESLFRGDLQPTLQRMLGRGAGLLLTALVFAAYHLRFGLWGLLGKTAFGLLFGILRDRTGRLVSPAVAHWISWTVMGFH